MFCDSTTLPDGAKGLFPGERRMLFREGFWNSDESMPFTSANSPENFLLSPLAPILAKYFAGAQLRASCCRFMTGLDRVLCVSMLEMLGAQC